jgi:hypothetical protein
MRWRPFAGWVLVGALGGLTAIAIFSIGIFVAPIFVLAGVFVARRTQYPLDALGLVVGLGIPCLAVAFANRDSNPCVADSFNSCGGFDPHPWLAAGLTLVVAGASAYFALRLASTLFPCRRAAK